MPSLMTNENVRLFWYDRLLRPIVIRIPDAVRPNHLTVFRFFMIPVVLYFFLLEQWSWAFVLFLIAALSDVLDGSLARCKKQITLWGTVADPIADKLLIGSAAIVLVTREVSGLFAALVVMSELFVVANALVWKWRGGGTFSANVYGKTKMFFQCVGVLCLLGRVATGWEGFQGVAIGSFVFAMIVALASARTYRP